MSTRIILAAVALATSAYADTAQAPAASVTSAVPTTVQADLSAVPTPNQVVYLPRLPSAAELSNAASAQGLAVDRIVQTANQVVVIYHAPTGQTNTVAYMLIPGAGVPAAPAVTPAPAPATTTTTVVYTDRVYYNDGYYYGPWGWYAPVAIGVGFNWGYHGYYHGGFWHR